MKIAVTKRIEFDAAHRLFGYGGKCQNLHGHRYVAEIAISGTQNDLRDEGMILDFSFMDLLFKTWIDDHWDHATLLHSKDPILQTLITYDLKVFPFDSNPTAEVMAVFLFGLATSKLRSNLVPEWKDLLSVDRVRIYETPNSYADAES